MTTLLFDTYSYVKELQAVGFSEPQAEVLSKRTASLLEEQIATKRDLTDLKKDLDLKIEQMYRKTMFANAAMLSAAVGLLVTLDHLLPHLLR